MIYLDNAATSFPKPEEVINQMNECMTVYAANPGRGGHALSLRAGRAVWEAREQISDFFGVSDPTRLAFTKGATEAINAALYGFLKPGDHVITTAMEHNAVIRPLKTMERDAGIEITIIPCNIDGEIDTQDIKQNIRKNTRLVVSTLSSNVNGMVMPVKQIGQICKSHGIAYLLDASQGAGSIPINVIEMSVDMMAFPGHKGLLGPPGIGGLYIKEGLQLRPLTQGGTGSHSECLYQPEEMPDLMESGTLNTPGIVGMAAGVGYIQRLGINTISEQKNLWVRMLHETLSQLKNVSIYSDSDQHKNSGIVAFNFHEVSSTEVCYVLDKVYQICARGGLHCAPVAHETLGTTETGIVRISPSHINSIEEINKTCDALVEISKKLLR